MLVSKLNGYAVASQFLIDQFDSNSLVNTVIYGVPEAKDLNRTNIFPIVNISPSTLMTAGNRLEIEFDIAVLDIRKIPNQLQTSKIFGDNLIDSLNTCSAIITKEITKLDLQRNEFDIVLVSSTAARPIIFSETNLLDGWETTIVISIQNEIETLG